MSYYFTSLFTIKYAEMSVLQNHFCFSFLNDWFGLKRVWKLNYIENYRLNNVLNFVCSNVMIIKKVTTSIDPQLNPGSLDFIVF